MRGEEARLIQLLGKVPAEDVPCETLFLRGGVHGLHQIIGGQQGIAAGFELFQRGRNFVNGEERNPFFIVPGDVEAGQSRRVREEEGKGFVVGFRWKQERFCKTHDVIFSFGFLTVMRVMVMGVRMACASPNDGQGEGGVRFFIEMDPGQGPAECPPRTEFLVQKRYGVRGTDVAEGIARMNRQDRGGHRQFGDIPFRAAGRGIGGDCHPEHILFQKFLYLERFRLDHGKEGSFRDVITPEKASELPGLVDDCGRRIVREKAGRH